MKENYQIEKGAEGLILNISLRNGDIEIKGEEGRLDIEVDIPELRKNSISEIYDLKFEGNELLISEKKSGRGFKFMDFSGGSDVFVKVPKELKSKGKIVLYSGDMTFENLKFEGSANTYSGDILLKDIDANKIVINSYNGDVTAERFNGALNIGQYNGDISIKRGKISGLKAKNYNGDVEINADFTLEEDSLISSMSGDVEIDFESYDGDKVLSLSSLGGDIDLSGDYPEDKVVIKKKMDFGGKELFKGFKPMIKNIFSTFNANKDNIEVEVEEKKDKKTDDNIERVLKMVADGKITAEQAEKLINALG